MYQSRLEKRIERKLLGKRRTDDAPIGNCFLILSTHVLYNTVDHNTVGCEGHSAMHLAWLLYFNICLCGH